jgi:hypothetical protein
VATQTNICNLLGIPSSSTEEEIVDAYVEILQNELSGKALVPRDRFDEVYRTYQEWSNWKKQSLALVKVLQEESLKGRTIPRNEFEDFYTAYQEWTKLKKKDPLLLDTSEADRPSLVIRLSATQVILALIPISAVAIGILWGGSILVYQKNRQEPTVLAEAPVNKTTQAVPNNQTAAVSPTNNAPVVAPPTPKPVQLKPVETIKQNASPKPAPAVAQQKSATLTIPPSNLAFSKIPALPALPALSKAPLPTVIKPVPQKSLPPFPQLSAPPKVSAAPAQKTSPPQTLPNLVGSYESPVDRKSEGPESSDKSAENTLQALQATPIELENGSTIPASQLLKLNLSQDPQKARKLSKFLKELETSRDIALARLTSEITIPQLQELAKEAKSLP